MEIGDRRFVQNPYGEVQWTRNLRAAGVSTLTTGRRTERVWAARLSQAEAATFYGETLPPYLNRSFFTRFFVSRNLGMAPMAKNPEGAAATHPVFELHHLEDKSRGRADIDDNLLGGRPTMVGDHNIADQRVELEFGEPLPPPSRIHYNCSPGAGPLALPELDASGRRKHREVVRHPAIPWLPPADMTPAATGRPES